MIATLHREWELHTWKEDGTTGNDVYVGPGTVELERIPNPLGYKGFWLIIKGTNVGMAEGAWRQWEDFTDEWQIQITE